MSEKMFCYQCEQTAGGTGCTVKGVCGKSNEISRLQDLIIAQLKGIATYGREMIKKSEKIDEEIIKFIENGLFMTLTNVNFKMEDHIKFLEKSQEVKEEIAKKAPKNSRKECNYVLGRTIEKMLEDAYEFGVKKCSEEVDINSLIQTITYGLKGVSAYAHQARCLGYKNEKVDKFYFKALECISDPKITFGELLELTMETGEMAVEVMKTLDLCNTEEYEHPKPTKVNIGIKKGPFIIVSGHDLKDLEMLLKQTEGLSINIYTHGEMLPAHGYEKLKKYKHLVGNFGGAWQNQQKEFDGIQGCILMTTNCIMKPRESYEDRIFTTSVVGYENIVHINEENGNKDFSPIINKALELGGFTEEKVDKDILVGFARNAVLSNAEKIIELVKEGKIRRFFLIGGCDGAKPGRNYFKEIATKVPNDCIILTLACGKYRFNKLDFGDIEGIPRLLDIGQCNDAYSAIKIALALGEAFNVSVNELPLSIILSWYEQKAVADLLALLYLGIKNIKIGPSVPAFLSQNVLDFLVKNYSLTPIKTADEDLAEILKSTAN